MNVIFSKITDFFSRMFEKNIFNTILSILAAIVIWFVVSVSVYPTIPRIIYNVPIQVDMTGTYAEQNNYQVVNQTIETVTVYIEGERKEVSNLTAEDLVAVIYPENVFKPATYNLPINIVCSSGKQFDVKKIVVNGTSADNISLEFDEIITKEIAIKPILRTSDVTVAPGFILDDVVIQPETVAVTGPKEAVEKISGAYIRVHSDTELSSTFDFVANEVSLYNGSAEIIEDTENLTFNKSTFNVHVPILQKQTVSLNVRIANTPEKFNTESFTEQLALSAYELSIAAPSELIKDLDHIDIGTIDMREVDIGSVFTFNTADFLPDGYQNLSGVNTITVTCPSANLAKTSLYIRQEDFQIINVPAQFNYEIEIISSGITPYFIGPTEIIEQLTFIDIIANIDLSNFVDMTIGDYKCPITFSIPGYDNVWCIGTEGSLSPKVTITVK